MKLCSKTAICFLTLHWWIYHTSTYDVSVTKSCAISFYAICFFFSSSYKAFSFWNSDTLDAIVESAMSNDTIEHWISSSVINQKILVYMVPILLSSFFFVSERGTLVCS